MEGHLQIKGRKLLESNKKYWFVLGREKLEYYTQREDVSGGVPPIACVEMKNVLDVRVAHDQRNTLALIRQGQESLMLKVKDGQMHNWLGSIRESIFSAREGSVDVRKKMKKKAIRSTTRTIGHRSAPINNRLSRSTSDLSNFLSVPQSPSSSPGLQVPKETGGCQLPELTQTSQMRSRKYSGSSSSIFSGSSVGSRGSYGHSKKKARLPVSGFTGRVFLANEMKMLDKPDIITNEDFEYIVQAERSLNPDIGVKDEAAMDVIDGAELALTADENDDVDNARNVTFNSTDEVSLIEVDSRSGRKKAKKERKRTKIKNDMNYEVINTKTEQSKTKFSNFGWFTLRKRERNTVSKVNQEETTLEKVTSKKRNLAESTNSKEINEKEVKSVHNQRIIQTQDQVKSENKSNTKDPLLNLESVPNRPRCFTDSELEIKPEDLPLKLLIQTDSLDSPSQTMRIRLNSVSSTNSRDSSSGISATVKDKIFNWKRASARSSKNVIISNPLELEQPRDLPMANDVNEQIDKIAHERLSKYTETSIDKDEGNPESEQPPALPKKPLKFHIKQLRKLISGDLNPPNIQEDKSDALLLLDSLLVMQSMEAVSCQDPAPSPLYDVPRRCYD